MVLEKMKAALPGEIVRDEGERSSVPGLYLKTHPGRKSFMLYYRSKDGVQRRPRIGYLGPMTLAQARSIAKELLDRVARGEDPQSGWTKARQEMTLSDLFERVYREYWSKPRFVKSGWGREVEGIWKRCIEPDFGARKLSTITVTEVKAWHATFENIPYAGNRALEVLTKMFNHAEAESLIPRNTSPCWRIRGFTEKKRKRYATPSELVKILSILEREKSVNPSAVAFLYCILFTGSRPSALERATYDELREVTVDGEIRGVLVFAGKGTADSGEDELVVIPTVAMDMIRGLKRNPDGRIFGRKNPRRFWVSVRTEAGCPDLWARDLRRTFATVGMSGGVNKSVIGELLNHASLQTTDIYAKLDLTARLEASKRISERILEMGKVVPIR